MAGGIHRLRVAGSEGEWLELRTEAALGTWILQKVTKGTKEEKVGDPR